MRTLVIFLIFFFQALAYGQIPTSERQALIAIYNATSGDVWNDHSGWKTPPLAEDGFAQPGTEGTWFGVWCDEGHVLGLDFRWIDPEMIDVYTSNNMLGTIPEELGNLKYLESLYMISERTLSGHLPHSIGDLVDLKVLSIKYSGIEGNIPEELTRCEYLSVLDLSSNRLYGKIPNDIGKCSLLSSIDLSNNKLGGPLPDSFWDLVNLQSLNVSDNLFRGRIDGIGNFKKAWTIRMRNNRLGAALAWHADIPRTIGGLTELRTLDLSDNKLEGALPEELQNLQKMNGIDTPNHPGHGLSLGGNKLSLPFAGDFVVWLDKKSKDWRNQFRSGLGGGDFNHDSIKDLLWQNRYTGQNKIYRGELDGFVIGPNVRNNPSVAEGWTILGVGDLDGDGYADIVWKNPQSGLLFYWKMDGFSVLGGPHWLPRYDHNRWEAVRVADMNKDNCADILFRRADNGANMFWAISGGQRVGNPVFLQPLAPSYQLVAVGDVDADGDMDLLWRNGDNGLNLLWIMDGSAREGTRWVQIEQNLHWEIKGYVNFGNDEVLDIIWRNNETGAVRVWIMDEQGARKSEVAISGEVSLDWDVVA